MKPDVLFLAHRIPYPPDKGDKIRSWRLVDHLTARFRVHLAAFVDDPRDFAHRTFLEERCQSVALIPLRPPVAKLRSIAGFFTNEPLSFRFYRERRMRNAVRRARNNPLAAEIAFSSTMAPYLFDARAGVKRIVDFCDSDAEKWRQYATDGRWPLSAVYNREASQLAAAETAIANRMDASFAVTSDEAAIFNARNGQKSLVGWFSNGVDIDHFDPAQVDASTAPIDCLFVGAMDYRANVDGMLHFLRHAWPLIRQQKPDASLVIIGPRPVRAIKAFNGKDGVTVTGRVEDVRPWFKAARTVIAPLRVARGVQNKVLEAMAMARPVIATPEAMTGIGAPESAAFTAATEGAFANAVLGLLDTREQRDQIGAAARAFVADRFTWDAGLSRFDAALEKLGLYSVSSSSPSPVSATN